MYLKPFLVIQILAFLTTEIWSYVRLRTFGLEFLAKLEGLSRAGYIPIPLPHEMSTYLLPGSLFKSGSFFTFTLGFTLAVVAFGGAFCLAHFRLPKPIRLGWTIVVSAVFSFFLGFSPLELLLLIAFFGLAHYLVRIPEASFRKTALFSLIPLLLIPLVYHGEVFFAVRDALLQIPWGKRPVAFYYTYSPLAAELITPPTERTQVTLWTDPPLKEATRSWLLRRGVYAVSTQKGVDFLVSGDERTGPALLEALQEGDSGERVERLRKTTKYSIFAFTPLAIMLFFVLLADRLLSLSRYARIVVLVTIAFFSLVLIYRGVSRGFWRSTDTPPRGTVEEIRRWTLQDKRTGDSETRKRFLKLLDSTNPSLRLWAAEALAYLPSKENVDPLKTRAYRDPEPIVRCKAIFALSHQGDRAIIDFLESRLNGEEDWYVKHYLLRALRRLGWIG